ncbi:hypothetical protein [Saccharothrix obliqua]|uniref:hypothetical protein n=1 Tax=Saccharothrix obliqua TaxID=2861747 RepID=UPI001C5D2F18|nr:hypothetical protein [Saccharothrix obliqua]MBW4718279.1 hypothetical protein [Saccharothrix obliqua]
MPIAFDTTGLQQQDPTTWFSPATGDRVSLRFFDLVPDLPAALEDLPRLRYELAVLYGESGCLIEAHTVLLGGVPALLQVLKLPLPNQPTGQVFVASFTVPKVASSAVLMNQAPERGTTGTREAVLMARVGFQNWLMPHPYAPQLRGRLPFHAGDDPRFDPQFPDHPLTRVRAWAHHVLRTAAVDPRFAALPPFPGPNRTHTAPPGEHADPSPVAPEPAVEPGTSTPGEAAPDTPAPAAPNPAVPSHAVPEPPAPVAPSHAAPEPPAPAAPSHAAPEPPAPVAPSHAAPESADESAAGPAHAAPEPVAPAPGAPVAASDPGGSHAGAPSHAAPDSPAAEVGPAVGSTLTTVVPGLPIGGYLPLWVGDECTFWRMDNPADVLDLLGRGLLARAPLAEGRFRDLVALDPDSSTIVLLNRYRSDDGNIAAGIAGLTRVSGQEASDGMTEDTLVEAFRWVGRASAAAAERGECVTVEPGAHTGELQEPYVLMVVQDFDGEKLSVVQTAPTPPADLPLWQGKPSMSGPATVDGIVAGGLLAMYAMDTWGIHPLHMCLTFGPAPRLVRPGG